MPKYYFHLENSACPVPDTEGRELDNLDAAKCHAVTVVADALCEHPKGFWETDTYQITATDSDGLNLFMICMMSVMAPAIATNPAAHLAGPTTP